MRKRWIIKQTRPVRRRWIPSTSEQNYLDPPQLRMCGAKTLWRYAVQKRIIQISYFFYHVVYFDHLCSRPTTSTWMSYLSIFSFSTRIYFVWHLIVTCVAPIWQEETKCQSQSSHHRPVTWNFRGKVRLFDWSSKIICAIWLAIEIALKHFKTKPKPQFHKPIILYKLLLRTNQTNVLCLENFK